MSRINDAAIPEKGTEAEKEIYMISHIINLTKKGGNEHYVPILLGNANRRLGKAKFHTLRIILESGTSSPIVPGKLGQKLRHTKDPSGQMYHPRR